MASFGVLVCLLALVALCNAQCEYEDQLVQDLDDLRTSESLPRNECVDKDGTEHELGSEWERDCMDCSCTSEGLLCCSKMPDGQDVDIPEDCELILDKEDCTAKLVLKSDQTQECDPV